MDIELRKIQLCQLEIAKEIKRICEKNNISYCLIAGTLLGAVRHKGFIPWDDDLDIGFTRENYEKFLVAAKKELSSDYYLQEWETDNDYAYPFGKIRMNDTLFVEETIKKRNSHMGIFVDIFPYDYYPENNRDQRFLKYKLTLLRQIITIKTGYCEYISFKGNTKRQIVKMLLFPFLWLYSRTHSKKYIIERFEREACKYNKDRTKMLYEHSGASPYGKWVVPAECFTDTIKMRFEDTEFDCPANYDEYLKIGFGDYMVLPPEDKRTNRHGIIKIKFKE